MSLIETERRTVWMENLSPHNSRFTDRETKETWQLEPAGFIGSIVQVPERVFNGAFMQKNVRRKRVAKIEADQVEQRIAALTLRPEDDYEGRESPNAGILDALKKGASHEVGTRYKDKGLDDYGYQKGRISAEEVFGGHPGAEAKTTPDLPTRPRGGESLNDEGNGVAASETDIGGVPLPPEAVLTDRVVDPS